VTDSSPRSIARTLAVTVIRMELLDIGSRFPAKSFDCVVALDVIGT
jgi:hypothetical protein